MRRRGFTLIEALVTLGVMALLVALLLPAVQASRNAALRLSCMSNLKQIGLAIANYESAFGFYPASTFRYPILPYIDQQALFDVPKLSGLSPDDSAYWDGLNDKCPAIYRCPSDPAPKALFDVDSSNYFGCGGTWWETNGYDGIFSIPGLDDNPVRPGQWVRVRDVADGLSNTALCSEKLRTDGTKHRLRTGWQTPQGYDDLELFTQTCESIPPNPLDYGWRGSDLLMGRPWHGAGFEVALYNHGSPPNRPSCINRIFVPSGLWTATSLHSGGVNVVFADGHLTFVSETIDRGVWREFGSRIGSFVGP